MSITWKRPGISLGFDFHIRSMIGRVGVVEVLELCADTMDDIDLRYAQLIRESKNKILKEDRAKRQRKTLKHIVSSKVCRAHGIVNCQTCEYSTGDEP